MENWKPIPGYEGIYSISDGGRVRIEIRRQNIRAGDMLKQTPQRDGYLFVGLNRTGKDSQNRSVARLVLLAFVGEPAPKHQANHKNGCIIDNRLKNLEWVSLADNIRHSIHVLGHTRAGEKNPAAKLTEEDVVRLREQAARGDTYVALGEAFGVTNVMARLIATGRAWKTAGGPISGPRPIGRRPRL